MEPNKNWENRIEAGKQEFIRKFQKTYGEKYRNRIFKRLAELKEVKREYNLSPYLASSKQDYIVFFKEIPDSKQFQYVLEHEIFHFIQKQNSKFEQVPKKYETYLGEEIQIALLEEAFVQYFTASINGKKPEYTEKDANGQIRKYWLNKCYKNIVGIVEELEEKIGNEKLLDMYMDDICYEKEIAKFDEQYGENAFAKYMQKICKKRVRIH